MTAKHAKPTERRVAVPVLVGVAALLIVAAVVAGFLRWRSRTPTPPPAADAGASVSDTTSTTAPDSPAPEGETPSDTPPTPVFSRPEELRGVFLTAGVDYAETADETSGRAQLDAALDTVADWGWNTLLLPLSDSQIQATAGFDAPAYLLEEAHKRGMYVYLVLDCGVQQEAGRDPLQPEDAAAVQTLTTAMMTRYAAADGVLFTGYAYRYGTLPDDEAAAGSAIAQMLREAVGRVRAASPNAYIGLLTSPVWAHASVQEGGSDTANVYEELTDGGADTRALVQSGLVDFVMVRGEYATEYPSAPFSTVLNWWAEVCTAATGWRAQDQLARQVLACRGVTACSGSAFDSLAALLANPESTEAMRRAFAGTLTEEYITRTLTLTSPTATKIDTYESAISLRGSADPNFPLTLNGEPVELTEHGYFSLDRTLQYGDNVFTFETKGITTTYTVVYRVQILQRVAPDQALTLDGGASMTISAVAREGAVVYATVNGTRVDMAPVPLQEQEGESGAQDTSDFVTYAGVYTLPAGVQGKEQALGAITVTGEYKGQSEEQRGGTVTVAALPVVAEPEKKPITLPQLDPIDPATGGETLASGTVLIIKADYAETFSGDTTDDYSRPTNAYLPMGTTDRLVRTAYDASSKNHYYLLGCGRRVYQEDAEVYITNGTLSENTLTHPAVTVSGKATTLTLQADWRIPFNLQLLPQSYANPSRQDYTTDAQTTEYIDITFSYTAAVQETPDVSASPLFSRAEWRSDDAHTQVLRLYLTKTAQFYGYAVAWDNEGQLTFRFRHPTSVAQNDAEQPLRGFKVVIDPGHGGNSVGTAGGRLAEKTLTLSYGLLLRDKLEAMGATVVMTRTDDSSLSLLERTQIARPSDADLFISVHMNGSTSASVRGCTVHYFSDYSRGLAERVYEKMQGAYTSFGCARRGGWPWSPFYVCRVSEMPALLLECGYMTNADDLELLGSAAFQDALMTGVARAVLEYAQSLPTL